MRWRNGFTLIEFVVVILIIGILTVIAAPTLVEYSGKATDEGLQQTLRIVRDAIQLHSAQHGTLPGTDNKEKTFKEDLEPFLRHFPENPRGGNSSVLDRVKIISDGADITTEIDNNKGWIYHSGTGEFRANTDASVMMGMSASDL